jgi:metal-dependent amidase/aminoacylase/carboxypeptidase family protein
MNAPLPTAALAGLPPALDEIRAHEDEMVAIRHQIHANPELAYEEHATADLVAERCSAGATRCTAAWAAPAWSAR